MNFCLKLEPLYWVKNVQGKFCFENLGWLYEMKSVLCNETSKRPGHSKQYCHGNSFNKI